MMNWKQVSIETTKDAADIVSFVFIDAGTSGVEIVGGEYPVAESIELYPQTPDSDTVLVKAYFDEHGFEDVLTSIKAQINMLSADPEISFGELDVKIVADTDWNENFKKHFTAFKATDNIVIKPTWEQYESAKGDIVIEMDPGLAFGSGVHETTRMCLELAQKYLCKNDCVLDVGCGSGILGIACAKLGAKEVLALDYDNTSVKVTSDNALLNSVDNLVSRRSDLLKNAGNKKYNVVLANIIADIIIRLNNDVAGYMAQDAVYIMSGIIEDRLDGVLASLEQKGFSVLEITGMGDWRAVAARRPDA